MICLNTADVEYWDENDSDVDNDFSQDKCSDEPLTPNPGHESQEDGLNQDERSVIWWVVAFTCVFETLHSMSSRAMAWLLHLLGSLFCFLSQYSKNIANIAHAFPSTLHQRSQYINEKLSLPSLRQYVVCQACLSLNAYDDCLERRGSRMLVKSCPHLEVWRHFVLASRLLCKRQLSKDEIKVADALLLRFCSRFQTLYGPQTVTPNIHFHSHLSACIGDYGPMSTFWLFSFERFNGILGDEPTNNRSIELQLLTRFVKDNAHLQLLSSIPSGSIEMSDILSRAVIGHAFNFTSTRHLDTTSSTAPSKADFLPATKYTISSFSSSDMDILSDAYRILYPAVLSQCHSSSLPQSYRKMLTVTIKVRKLSLDNLYMLAVLHHFLVLLHL